MRARIIRRIGWATIIGWVTSGSPVYSADVAAPGYSDLGYTLASPGSYTLPILEQAGDGRVLTSTGSPVQLHTLYAGKYSLISFIYSNCSDLNGCPLSAYVFYRIKAEMQKNPEIAERLQLISLSFDPARDTPAVMQLYGNNFGYAGERGDWHFLTTQSEKMLSPILQDYNQDLQRYYSLEDSTRVEYAHILRVFLVDPDVQVRNIYSVGFLHPDILLNDVKTLMLEREDASNTSNITMVNATLSTPGDAKTGYHQHTYQSQSRSLPERQGQATSLLENALEPGRGLPPLPGNYRDSLSEAKIRLGQKLFFDRRLSLNETVSCAMCHVPEQGFTSNELATAVGIEGRTVRRNSPSLYNVAYYERLFHDGRETSLAQQAWGPLLARNEMANPSVGFVIDKLHTLPDYTGQFEAVFHEAATMQNVGDALAAYQASLVSADSPFDRWHFGGEEHAISAQAQTGFALFSGKAGCVACHTITHEDALFTDQQLHNLGTGYRESMQISEAPRRVALAPGVFVNVENSIIDSVSEKPPSDLGLYEITQNPADRWKYRTPSLRNIALTAPYMHNGSFQDLRTVVEFYNQGGVPNEELDPLIKPLNLNTKEIDALVALLESLTGSNVNRLVSDAFAAPVGDPY